MSSKRYYIYKCDDCGYEWKAPASPQPTKCPKCGSENFHIHAEVSTPWVKILTFIVVLALLGVGGYFAYINIIGDGGPGGDGDGPGDGDSPPPPKIESYILKYNTSEDGIIKITTDPEGLNYDSLEFSFRSDRSGKFIKRDGDKLYPCVGGPITFTYNKTKDINVEEDEVIGDYKLTNVHPDSDCNQKVEKIIAKAKFNKKACTYVVSIINKDKFPGKTFEYSWNNKNKWEASNKKNAKDFGDLNYVLVRVKNNQDTEVNAINTPQFPNCEVEVVINIDDVINTFNTFKNNLRDFDAYFKFVELQGDDKLAKCYLNGNSYSFEKFARNMRDKVESVDPLFANPENLEVDDVDFNQQNRLIKLKVK